MKRVIALMTFAVAVAATSATAQVRNPRPDGFASDLQTIPVAANVPGVGGTFQSYVALFNPTASAFTVTATLYDANGTAHTASIPLPAGAVKSYDNFLDSVFSFTGGGAVVLSAPQSAGGTHNNRFIVNTEVRTGGTRYSTSVPVLEFAGSSSRSFSPGISVGATTRTNVGCFNESANANLVAVTILDSNGNSVGSTNLVLAPNGWGQAAVTSAVSGGTAQFDPSDNAVCYAVVVDNATNDGRFVAATEYQP